MSSQKPHNATELPQSPAVVPEVTPTLVVLWGPDAEAMKGLQANVVRRLAFYFEIGVLRWAGPFSPDAKIDSQKLAKDCEPLLSWDLWQRLVEKGYQSSLPAPGSPARLRVVLVVDRMTGQADGLSLKILEELQGHLGEQVDLAPVLIWLGKKPTPPPEGLDVCWPRIRMEPVAAGGIGVDPQLVWEATEHLIVALMGSAFLPAVNQSVRDEETEWLVAGASALLLHPDIEKWLQEAVLREVLRPLVAPLPEAEADRIEKKMGEYAQKIREALLEEATAALREVGWEIGVEGLAVKECTLGQDALLKALFGPYRGGVIAQKFRLRNWKEWPRQFWALINALAAPFLPDQHLGKILHRHYQECGDRIEQWVSIGQWRGLAPRAQEEVRDLRVLLGAFLDRGMMSEVSSEKQSSWWFTERPLPTGLPALLMALLALEKHLSGESDVKDVRGPSPEWVRPEPLNTEGYLRTAGDTDAMIVRGNLQRYAHFARTIASPWGVFLYLLPAWPLTAFLVQLMVQWKPVQAVLATGLGLLVIGIAELFYWWFIKARRLLKIVQREAHRYLADRILRLTASVIRDYRWWILTQLWEAELALRDLYSALWRRYAETEKALWALEKLPYAKGNTYILANKEEIQEWKKRAQEAVRQYSAWLGEDGKGKFENAVTALIVREVWPLSEQPMSAEVVVKTLIEGCMEAVRGREPLPGLWSASVAAEKIEELKDGRRWNWLWNRAYPLGSVESPIPEFTFMLVSEEFITGPTGKGSRYWQPDWQTISTFQKQEEVCIRVMVEPQRGA